MMGSGRMHSFNKYLLRAFRVPDPVVSTENMLMNETDLKSVLI